MLTPQEIRTLDKRHIIHSWSVQHALEPMVVDRTEGVYFWDAAGKRYLDFSSALVNMSVGYQHPKVVAAIQEQAAKYCYIRPEQACEARSRLGRDLAALTPGDLNHFFFTLGGADANENAVKMARAFTGKHKILTKFRSYHGATYGAITLSCDPRRMPVEPGIPGVVHFPDPFCYRCPLKMTYPACDLRCADYVQQIIDQESAATVAAVLIETQTGANGFYPPPPDYFTRLREICDRNEVLLILDEVMVGCGRTGKWFASEHYDVVPDMMTLAKGLTCGYVPFGAVAVSDRIMAKLGNEMLWAGLTYSAHPLACATSSAVLQVYQEEKLIENAAAQEPLVRSRLERIAADHDIVGDVRGNGLFFCIELVADRETKAPLDAGLCGRIRAMGLERGISLNVMRNMIFIGPPLIVTAEQIEAGLDMVDDLLGELVGMMNAEC